MSKRVAFIHKTRLIIILFIEFIIRNGISPYCPHGLIKVNGVVRRPYLQGKRTFRSCYHAYFIALGVF